MLDIQFIRENPELVQEKSNQKNYKVDIAQLLSVDERRRSLLGEVEGLRARRNELSASMKQGKPTEEQIAVGRELKDRIAALEEQLAPIEKEFITLLKTVPNMPLDDVPVGATENENVVSKEWGEKPQFDFAPRNHAEIAEAKGWLDKERAAKVAGARFAYLKGDLVLLDWAMN
ncbi:MAG: serS, partial [Candidatus Saccharibacteria bacterium]|nr:serS [Candidatus Saccharibacteria bacterium]